MSSPRFPRGSSSQLLCICLLRHRIDGRSSSSWRRDTPSGRSSTLIKIKLWNSRLDVALFPWVLLRGFRSLLLMNREFSAVFHRADPFSSWMSRAYEG
ncbi:hypothetical protein MLD38_004898 [Melastoma candidum]|uniref:Uncharacterized protein n=1 Tax=Melastoma candidum TaxID=119954 RepID=A0ACB9SB34_9MYRT|nr:hypothetical protein MLD38_004898 [Melastoma candidum]